MKIIGGVLVPLFLILACNEKNVPFPEQDLLHDEGEDTLLSDDEAEAEESEIVAETDADLDEILPDGDFEPVIVIPKAGIELEAIVDLRQWESGTFPVTEKISFPAPDAGNTIRLFGEKMSVISSSVPFDYDNHTFLFFFGDFSKNERLSLEVSFSIKPASSMGLRIWQDLDTGDMVIGPFTEPYFTPYWLIVPQSPFKTDKDNDANVPVEKVTLRVIAPDDQWQVLGPGVTGTRDGAVWTFTMETPMPFYALSFAASPDYTLISAGKTSSGIEIIGAGFPQEKERLEAIYPAGVTTVEWMEEHIGPYEFGNKVGLVSIPDFGGGMEHVGVIYMGTDVLDSYDSGVFVTVHEIVHNWWGNNVRFSDWPDFWVAEGFDEWTTNYNLMAAIEDASSFADRREQYRFIAAFLCSAADAVPLRFSPDLDFMSLDVQMQTAYYYGAAFLEMVNKRLMRDFNGKELLPLLRLWFEEKHQLTVTTEDFLAFLIAHTSESTDSTDYWKMLFDDWVYRAPCPTLVASDYLFAGGTLSFTLTHTGMAPSLPAFPIVIEWEDASSSTLTVDLDTGGTALVEVPATAAPARILVDPDWFYVFALDTTLWDGPSISFTEKPPALYGHRLPVIHPTRSPAVR